MKITLQGNPAETIGHLPTVGTNAAEFSLVKTDLSEISLHDLNGQKVLLNIFPSLDTPVCALSVVKFNQEAAKHSDYKILCISMDLPFALERFCGANGIKNVIAASAFRSPNFGKDYGITITTLPLKGLLARAVLIINAKGEVTYTELVPEITQEPNYEAALKAM